MSTGSFIGVLDSGVGGMSVLARMVELLPEEHFVYFGDSAFTPYGEKGCAWVLERTGELAASFIEQGAKAIVIACNTATSAAAPALREAYAPLPIVGIEPALKPAALAHPGGNVLVMATPMTLALEKFQHLADEWSNGCTVWPVACEVLAARIEQGNLDAPDLEELVEHLVGEYRGRVDAVVLGCTHYPLIADVIRDVLGAVPLYDGSEGTAHQLARRLEEAGLNAPAGARGRVELRSSRTDDATRKLYHTFAQRVGLSADAILETDR